MNNNSEASRKLWEELADNWDERMGESDNRYHREIIRPATLKLLDPQHGDYILDAACGNGNFSRYLADCGARVTAFDYSARMIEHAKERGKENLYDIDFHVADATDYNSLMQLRADKPFNKAVSNMAVMDIADIEPLFRAVYDLLTLGGIFVFSGVHPCFQTPNMKKVTETNDYTGKIEYKTGIITYEYIKPYTHKTIVFANNDKQVLHYHRPLSMILDTCFGAGFVLDGMEEPVFEREDNNNAARFDWYEIPPSIIIRLKKI